MPWERSLHRRIYNWDEFEAGILFRAAFLILEKSAIGNTSMAAMQKIPISRDFAKAQEAIPHRINGKYHT